MNQYKTFNLTVLGKAVGQGRPRISVRNGFAKAYDPAKSREEKENIRALATQKALETNWDKLHSDVPVEVTIHSYREIPFSKPQWYKKAAKAKLIVPTSKPDCDNHIKLVLDSLSGIVFADDKQVFKLNYMSDFDEQPRTEIEVKLYYVNIGEIKEKIKDGETK